MCFAFLLVIFPVSSRQRQCFIEICCANLKSLNLGPEFTHFSHSSSASNNENKKSVRNGCFLFLYNSPMGWTRDTITESIIVINSSDALAMNVAIRKILVETRNIDYSTRIYTFLTFF